MIQQNLSCSKYISVGLWKFIVHSNTIFITTFVVDTNNSYNYLLENAINSIIILQDNENGLIDYIIELQPQLVINDILDTEEHYIKMIRN